jgi:hypothetical protein
MELGHKIDFDEAIILARSAGYTGRMVKEAIEILLHPNNFNRDSGFLLSQAWHLLINVLKKVKQLSDERVQRGHRTRNEETPGYAIWGSDRGRRGGGDYFGQHWLGRSDSKFRCDNLSEWF